jgi:uncharacterized membrane protein YfcA
MTDITEFLFLLFISIVANGFSAIAGGGAGLLQLPILLFLGLPFNIALSTHKIASVALGLGASARYYRENTLELYFALFVIAFGLPGVVLGARVILQIDEQIAMLALGILTISLGVYSFFKKDLGFVYAPAHRNTQGYILGGMVIFLIGLINGSLTSGTGLFLTLWLIYWFGLDYQRAVATTMILVGIFWNATGAATLALLTEVQWDWLVPLIIGALIGSYLGAHIAILKGNKLIKRLFEVATVGMGISLLLKVWLSQ